MRLAFIQTSPTLGATRSNLEQAYSLIERVRDADICVLPELFHSGYAVRSKSEAESLSISADESSETLEMLLDASRKFAMTLVAGILERTGHTLFNSAWMIGPEGILGTYRKIHLFNSELDIFSQGDKNSPIIKINSARVGMQICFDWIFPENWGRLAWGTDGTDGAQIIAHPANLVIPDACPLALRTRAMENRVFIVSAGRIGVDPGPNGDIEFRAGSRIIAPDGTILAAGSEKSIDCDMVQIDPDFALDKFVTPRNNVLFERFSRSDDPQTAENLLSR